MSAPRYEVRCRHGAVPFEDVDEQWARAVALAYDDSPLLRCGPHSVWSIDPDGTETDITDEQGAQE